MLYKATKVIIVTENLIAKKVCSIIEESKATGYTIVPAGGKGSHNFHSTSDKATVVEDFVNIKIEVIVKDKNMGVDIITRLVEECFEDYSGITYLEEVEINRPEKF